MTTIGQVAEKIVKENIDLDYVKDCGKNTVGEVYQAEYGYKGLTDTSCKDYLQGLPSMCTVPFYNNEILEILKEYGITVKSEKAQQTLLDKYWQACGAALHKYIRRENKA
jgi:hypothetical protein